MSTESYLWGKLKVMPDSDFQRHEDSIGLGVPDVSYGLDNVCGWIELKAFPKRMARGVYKFHNFKKWQKKWLMRRGEQGGHTFLMLIIGKGRTVEYFLFPWQVLGELYEEELSLEELHDLAIYYSQGKINHKTLRKRLLDK